MNISGVDYKLVKENSLHGRYVDFGQIKACLDFDASGLKISDTGKSVEGKDIFSLEVGQGPLRLLMWSQMHGNESTTTKAVIDLLKTLRTANGLSEEILSGCTIRIIPILNPDGAIRYTRENANKVDLNRDAKDLSQPESKFLRRVFEEFKPDFCFNLHDQRSIFSAGRSGYPASLSFLAPAADENRNITASRKQSMQLIAAIHQSLPEEINRAVGRYDDAFNPNCVGDSFQMHGTPTVLFEAGHYQGDYDREETRKYIWWSLVKSILCITRGNLDSFTIDQYNDIPNNEKLFFDVLIRNAHFLNDKYKRGDSLGILYDEILMNKKIEFKPVLDTVGELNKYSGHLEYDCSEKEVLKKLKTNPDLSQLII